MNKQKRNEIFDLLSKSSSRKLLFGELCRQGKLIVAQLLLQLGDRSKLPPVLGMFESLVNKKATKQTAAFLRTNIVNLTQVFSSMNCVVYMLSTSKLAGCLQKISPMYCDLVLPNEGVCDMADHIVKREKPGSIVLTIRDGQVSVHGTYQLRQAVVNGTRTVNCLVYDFDKSDDSSDAPLRAAFSSLQDLMEVVGADSELLNPAFGTSVEDALIGLTFDGSQSSTIRAMYKSSRCSPGPSASLAFFSDTYRQGQRIAS